MLHLIPGKASPPFPNGAAKTEAPTYQNYQWKEFSDCCHDANSNIQMEPLEVSKRRKLAEAQD